MKSCGDRSVSSTDRARKRLSLSSTPTNVEVEAAQVPPTQLEVCQVMFERPRDDWTAQFSFADADFSRTTYKQMAKLGHGGYAARHRAPASRARVPHRGPRSTKITLSFIGTALMASTMKPTRSTPQYRPVSRCPLLVEFALATRKIALNGWNPTFLMPFIGGI